MLSPRLQHNAVLRNLYWGEVLAREQRPHIFAQTERPRDRSSTPRGDEVDMWKSVYQADFGGFSRRNNNLSGTKVRLEAPLAMVAPRLDGARDLRKTLTSDYRATSSQQSKRSSSARGASRPQTTDSRLLRSAGRAGMVVGTAAEERSSSLMFTRTRVSEHLRPPAGA
mmetsp:Transcript_5544/g.9661  ORF Transcript_5544/g.9661 Transcript_5544/m.9661 type:complete len:168 (+) Transcript_5544:77-580(+)